MQCVILRDIPTVEVFERAMHLPHAAALSPEERDVLSAWVRAKSRLARFILAVGRLVPYKGFDVLIRAMRWVDAKLVLIGTGPLGEDLRKLARSEGVEAKVSMPGRVDEIASYLAAASLFVLPSLTRAEAFGIVQLEAMATGVPVVNTELDSGVPEVNVHGQTGFTVPPGDPQALASAIQTLLDRQDLRDQFGRAAKERVHSEFTADLMCSRTMRVYEEVLGSL